MKNFKPLTPLETCRCTVLTSSLMDNTGVKFLSFAIYKLLFRSLLGFTDVANLVSHLSYSPLYFMKLMCRKSVWQKQVSIT